MAERCSASLQAEEWIHVNETECFCPASNQWTTLLSAPFSCCQFSIAAHEATLYLAGGGSLQHRQKDDSVFLYDTEGRRWQKGSALPRALADHASCIIKLPPVKAGGEAGGGTKGSPVGRSEQSTLGSVIAREQEPSSASERK